MSIWTGMSSSILYARRLISPRHILLATLAWFALAPHCAAQSTDDPTPEANPGRPTVATPATLTPVGYLQFETGFLGARQSPEFSSQYSWVETTKLSVAPRLEFLASFEPVARSTGAGISSTDAGDIALGVQALLRRGEGAKPSIALSYFGRVYTGAAADLDFGSPSNSVLLLASAEVHGFHYDANAFFNDLSDGRAHRAQFGQTLSISHQLSEKFSLTGELWHFTQPFLHGNALGNLWSLGYNAGKNLVFDAGFEHGFTSTSTRWEYFAGVTYLLPHRLWPSHRSK